jgi:GxxExxY protein
MRCPDDEKEECPAQFRGMDTHPNHSDPASRTFPEDEYPFQELTGTIIASSHAVFRAFGFGFLESVYRRALAVELRYRGVPVREEVRYELFHRGVSVGVYRADLVAESIVMVETKTGLFVDPVGPVQLLNCLCAARLTLGLLVHFGPNGARVKRVIAPTDGRRIVSRTTGEHGFSRRTKGRR